ncbi:MAG: TetR/AcrR family transcriptional regulator [Bacteroidetes bacterium]|nr:TetR/AcrR family transcriptional regulator [Bacteroidota bacterium]
MEVEERKPIRIFSEKELSIIQAAEKLFAQLGFDGTSVRDIAREAQVNVAMISYYFNSKLGLLEAVVSARIEVGRLEIEDLLHNKTIDPLSKIDRLIDGLVDRMMKHKSFHQISMRSQLNAENGQLNPMLAAQKKYNLKLITQLIQDGQKLGVFSKQVDIPLLVMTIIGTIYQAATGSPYFTLAVKASTSEQILQGRLLKKLKIHLKKVARATLTYEV